LTSWAISSYQRRTRLQKVNYYIMIWAIRSPMSVNLKNLSKQLRHLHSFITLVRQLWHQTHKLSRKYYGCIWRNMDWNCKHMTDFYIYQIVDIILTKKITVVFLPLFSPIPKYVMLLAKFLISYVLLGTSFASYKGYKSSHFEPLSWSIHFFSFMECEGLLLYPQRTPAGPYPEPEQLSPHFKILFIYDPFYYYSHTYA
jgi:hypothetical protein